MHRIFSYIWLKLMVNVGIHIPVPYMEHMEGGKPKVQLIMSFFV